MEGREGSTAAPNGACVRPAAVPRSNGTANPRRNRNCPTAAVQPVLRTREMPSSPQGTKQRARRKVVACVAGAVVVEPASPSTSGHEQCQKTNVENSLNVHEAAQNHVGRSFVRPHEPPQYLRSTIETPNVPLPVHQPQNIYACPAYVQCCRYGNVGLASCRPGKRVKNGRGTKRQL